MRIINKETRLVKLGEIKEHPQNPNKGAVERIEDSVETNGFYGSLIVQESTGYILSGNHRYKVAKAAGAAEIPVTFVDVDDETAKKILVADNRVGQSAEMDEKLIASLLEGLDSAGTGFTDEEFNELMGFGGGAGGEGGDSDEPEEIDETRADEIQRKWGVQLGDIYKIGRHVVGCGSCTDAEFVAKIIGTEKPMVITDPPYGIKVVKGRQVGGDATVKFGKIGGGKVVASSNYKPVANDDSVEVAEEFLAICSGLGMTEFIVWGGNYMTEFLAPSRCWIVWDKENTGNFADGELAWTSFDKGVRLYRWLWNGMSRKGDRATEGLSRYHPTQKPVGLHVLMLTDFNPDKKAVFDGFSGSGTTLLACEKYGCSGIGIDMEPAYVAVILERFHLQGIEPEKL